MIEIQIDNKYMIRSDKLNYTIAEHSGRKETGSHMDKYQWNDKHFFCKLEHLVDQLVERKMLAKEAKTLQDLADNINSVKKEILDAINKLK